MITSVERVTGSAFADTIQGGVDLAAPGDLVLVGPGVYDEAVVVTTPFLTIRGTDRNRVILDGGFTLDNGIQVIEADGVAIENMTARNYILNGFFWTSVFGYRGSYLTAYDNGDYGIYAYDSVYGLYDHAYASGSPDSGIYIGQCYPCHAIITDSLSENNGLGYSGTNAGGDLFIVNSEWRGNYAGIVPNTLDSEAYPPQRGVTIAGNWVHDNQNPLGAVGVLIADPSGTIQYVNGRFTRFTGYAESAQVGRGQLEAGMHMLAKPFTVEQLVERLLEQRHRGGMQHVADVLRSETRTRTRMRALEDEPQPVTGQHTEPRQIIEWPRVDCRVPSDHLVDARQPRSEHTHRSRILNRPRCEQVAQVEQRVAETLDRRPLRVEGLGEQQWVLMDYGDVVVHVFSDESRRFYEIERLYKDVEPLDWAAAELS